MENLIKVFKEIPEEKRGKIEITFCFTVNYDKDFTKDEITASALNFGINLRDDAIDCREFSRMPYCVLSNFGKFWEKEARELQRQYKEHINSSPEERDEKLIKSLKKRE